MTSLSAVDPTLATATVPPRTKRLLLAATGLAALVAAGLYAAHWWTSARFVETTDDAYIGGDITVIGPKVAGHIEQVLVSDNQRVKAGDVLIRLDARDYRAHLAKAEGAVAAQQALLANLDATEQLQQAVIGQARAGIDAAGAETSRSRDDNVRYKRLVGSNAVSVESAQRADATFKTAQALSARAQAELLAAQRQLNVITTQKQQARAALQQASAERDLAQLNVDYTELRAPVDGVIGNRRARVGGYAQVGAQLLSVVPASGLWVDANFKEDQLAHMQPGAMLINTGRGGLVDTPALIDALKSGQLGYLGLDVYEEEAQLFFEDRSDLPLQDDVLARLLTFPNVIVTAHQAFLTHEALAAIADTTLHNIASWAAGQPQNQVRG